MKPGKPRKIRTVSALVRPALCLSHRQVFPGPTAIAQCSSISAFRIKM